MEKDGKFYALVSSDQELVSVVSLDFDKGSYKILNTFKDEKDDIDLSPNLFAQSWSSNDKYLYILMRNTNAQEGEIVSNYLLRYDFKSNKFLKPLPLKGLEFSDGFEDIDTIFLYENTKDKFIVYTANSKDSLMHKITYDLESLKFEKDERLNLKIDSTMYSKMYNHRFVGGTTDDSRLMILDGKIYYISAVKTNLLRDADSIGGTMYSKMYNHRFVGGTTDDSRLMILDGKIYYISAVKTNLLRDADSIGGSEVNVSGMNTSTLKIFDIEKNKVVYEADFDSLDIESPIFIKGWNEYIYT